MVPGKEVHQRIPDALSRLCENNIPPPPPKHTNAVGQLSSLQLAADISLHSSVETEQPLQTVQHVHPSPDGSNCSPPRQLPRWNQHPACYNISVALVHLRSFTQTEAQPSTTNSSQSCFGSQARRDLWQLGTLQSHDARGQAPRLPPCKHNEDAHPKRTQVATENLSQDFHGIFPNKMLGFSLGF